MSCWLRSSFLDRAGDGDGDEDGEREDGGEGRACCGFDIVGFERKEGNEERRECCSFSVGFHSWCVYGCCVHVPELPGICSSVFRKVSSEVGVGLVGVGVSDVDTACLPLQFFVQRIQLDLSSAILLPALHLRCSDLLLGI